MSHANATRDDHAAENLLGVIRTLQKETGVHLEIRAVTEAATLLGLKKPDVSALVNCRVGKFSIERLVRCLDRLDYKVDLVVRQKSRSKTRAATEAA